jgi:hypothetical protein
MTVSKGLFIRILLLCIGFFTGYAPSLAALIPTSRLADWTPGANVGVPGGIPTTRTRLIDVTKAPYNANNTGAADAGPAINAAIAAAVANDVVYLPAGTYRLDTGIATGYKDNITIRGAGSGTVLKPYGASALALYIGGASDYLWNYPNLTIATSLAKGANVIPLTNTTAFATGNIVHLSILNDKSANGLVASVAGFERVRHQKSRVVSKTTNSITISPPIFFDMPASAAPTIARTTNVAEFVGVEDLWIDSSNSTAGFSSRISQGYGCWFKNVKITNTANRHLFLAYSVQCEVRHCDFRKRNNTGSNGAGLLFQSSSGCLIEDNIITEISSCIQINDGATGNVFAYNFLYDSEIFDSMGPGLKSNHGPHNSFNLFEGNIAPNFQCDGYFGGTSDDTLMRNWFHGSTTHTPKGWCISLNRFTRRYNLLGNVFGSTTNSGSYSFGNPNLGNSSYSGTAQPTAGDWWADWGTAPGAGGFQELDLDVQATVILKSNYLAPGGIPAAELTALAGESLPASLYRSSKPAWFGTLTWPAFNPSSPNMNYTAIPAGYRFVNGVEAPGSGGGDIGTAPSAPSALGATPL